MTIIITGIIMFSLGTDIIIIIVISPGGTAFSKVMLNRAGKLVVSSEEGV